MDDDVCEWLERCERPAVGDAAHQVHGVVKVCQVCVDQMGLTLIKPYVEKDVPA